ncbi:MAG: tetratricopeptide repeat protein [Syntrophaceae bacterium]|nr:tetratricopeptide repeat protein [Syntrophaceae bacterium]
MIKDIKTKIDSAENLLKQHRYDDAIVLLKELSEECPGEESIILMLSWACYDSGDPEQAVKYLNMLLERELQRKVFTGFAFDELVRIYKQTKDFLKLVEICERAAAAQPEDVCLLTELGNAYLQSGRAEKACEVYKKLIDMENDNPAFHCYRGEALFAAGLYQESEKAYLKAGEIDSEQPDRYYFKIAVLFQQAQNHEDAERLLKKCLTINSSNPLYYCSLGDTLVSKGKIQEAFDVYEKAVQCDHPRVSLYYNRLGNSLMKAGDFLKASDAFKLAIKYEPAKAYYLSLAEAYRRMGLAEQADVIIREVHKIVRT